MTRPQKTAQPTSTRTSRRSPAIAAGAAALAFAVGALVSGWLSEDEAGAQAAVPAGAAQSELQRRPTRIAPVVNPGTVSAGATAHPTHAAESSAHSEGAPDAHVAHTADVTTEHVGCQHGPGELESEEEYALRQRRAQAIVARGSAAILAALRDPDASLHEWIAGALLDDLNAFSEVDLVTGLEDLAADAHGPRAVRELAIELLGRSPASSATAVTRLGDLAVDLEIDEPLRGSAVSALRLLARERPDLQRQLRATLLASAAAATHPVLRADSLDGVRTAGATSTQIARLVDYLGDQDPDVRNGAARALGDSDLVHRESLSAAFERALQVETSLAAAGTLLESALRVGRRDAPALLERLGQAPIVRESPALSQQVADYRQLLTGGETDPNRVLQARHALIEQRLSGGPAQ